jgi:hypothetical protein
MGRTKQTKDRDSRIPKHPLMDCFATPHVASEKIDGNECEVETKAPALR